MKLVVNARFLTQTVTGIQRFAIEISKRIKQLRPEIQFVAPHNIVQRETALKLAATPYGRLRGHLWEQLELPLFLSRAGHPLLINLANTAPLGYKKQVVTIHDAAFLRNPAWFSRSFYHFYNLLLPRIAKSALRVITVSEFSKRELVELLHIAPGKIKVVHNAVSEKFSPAGPLPGAAADKYGDYVLVVGSQDSRKNLDTLISAFKKARLKTTALVIVGAPNKIFKDPVLKGIAATDERFFFTGYVSEDKLLDLYRNARLFVYPSLYEGFGLPPLEAYNTRGKLDQ